MNKQKLENVKLLLSSFGQDNIDSNPNKLHTCLEKLVEALLDETTQPEMMGGIGGGLKNYSHEPKAVDVTPPVKPVKWRAEEGKPYWFINDFEHLIMETECLRTSDNYRYLTGNYYKTREEAEQALEVIKAKGRLEHSHYALEYGFKSALNFRNDTISIGTFEEINYLFVNKTKTLQYYYIPKLDMWFCTSDSLYKFIKENEKDLKTVFGLTQSIND